LSLPAHVLWILLFVHAVAIPWALHVSAGTARQNTIVGHADQFASRSQAEDSWRPMRAALEYATQAPGSDIYEEVFFRRHLKFQYPPSALLFIGPPSNRTLNAISWFAVWTTAIITVVLLLASATERNIAPHNPRERILLGIASLGLCLTFYPLLKGYTLGQIQVWVTALFALATWAVFRGRQFTAGVCIGVACCIKPPLAPLAVWALVRREWRFAVGMAVAVASGLSLSVAMFGVTSHISYLRVLSFIAPRGEAYYPNHSVNGLLNRWFQNGSILAFDDFAFSPYHPVVAAGTTFTSAGLLLAALVVPSFRRTVDRRLDFAVMALTATIASPIVWEHHYGVVLPIVALTAPFVILQSPAGRATPWLLTLSFLLMAQYLHEVQRLAYTWWNPLQSYALFGALLLLFLLYGSLLVRRETVAGSPAHAP